MKKLRAMLHDEVKILHATTPAAMRLRRFRVSARPPERQAHERVEDAERQALQQAHLCIAEAEIALHGRDEQTENLPVDE